MGVGDRNQDVEPELQLEMEVEEQGLNKNMALVVDMVDECTEGIGEGLDLTYSRIVVLYVLSRVVDEYFEEVT
jgi:hypothetical protein